MVVEQRRVRDRNNISTTHVTVVRQGDRILSVVRPESAHDRADWGDERELITPSDPCPQGVSFAGGGVEDCLFINVWVPEGTSGKLPVMVWLHGGAFIFGSGSDAYYSGANLAAAQGVELRAPLATSAPLQEAHGIVRGRAAFWDRDRAFASDLARMREAVEGGEFARFADAALERAGG